MRKNIKTVLMIFFASALLSACASVSIQSQLAPDTTLNRDDPIYLEPIKNAAIPQQKYMAALKSALSQQGINTVSNRSGAKYIMKAVFNDFSATVNQTVPDVQTTYHQGHVGNVDVSATSTTYGNKTISKQVPTHNSMLVVSSRKTGQQVWQAEMAKSFDTYNHDDLEKMISKMLSLYGQDGKTSLIVEDEVRW